MTTNALALARARFMLHDQQQAFWDLVLKQGTSGGYRGSQPQTVGDGFGPPRGEARYDPTVPSRVVSLVAMFGAAIPTLNVTPLFVQSDRVDSRCPNRPPAR